MAYSLSQIRHREWSMKAPIAACVISSSRIKNSQGSLTKYNNSSLIHGKMLPVPPFQMEEITYADNRNLRRMPVQ